MKAPDAFKRSANSKDKLVYQSKDKAIDQIKKASEDGYYSTSFRCPIPAEVDVTLFLQGLGYKVMNVSARNPNTHQTHYNLDISWKERD